MTLQTLKVEFRNPSAATAQFRTLGGIISQLNNDGLDELVKSLTGQSLHAEFVDVPRLVAEELKKREQYRR